MGFTNSIVLDGVLETRTTVVTDFVDRIYKLINGGRLVNIDSSLLCFVSRRD